MVSREKKQGGTWKEFLKKKNINKKGWNQHQGEKERGSAWLEKEKGGRKDASYRP